jgi:hypothetical protein
LSLQTKFKTDGCAAEGICLRIKPILKSEDSLIFLEELENLFRPDWEGQILGQLKI